MRVAILYGGQSAEREVSLMTGREVATGLANQGYEVELFDFDASTLVKLREHSPDVVFIGLHGRLGEDGTVQGALEILGLPYVGSGVQASAIAIDKWMTRRLLACVDVPIAPGLLFQRGKCNLEEAARAIGESIGYPCVVKPSREGSTFGLTLARNPEEARRGLLDAFEYDGDVIAEAYIRGMEVTVAVVGEGEEARVLGMIEIVPRGEVYDYDSKYSEGGSIHIIPARLSAGQQAEIETLALRAYRTLGCRDYGRVDFMIGKNGPVLLEVNTLPGMTRTSLVPDAARAAGQSFGEFLRDLVQRAYERNRIRTPAGTI